MERLVLLKLLEVFLCREILNLLHPFLFLLVVLLLLPNALNEFGLFRFFFPGLVFFCLLVSNGLFLSDFVVQLLVHLLQLLERLDHQLFGSQHWFLIKLLRLLGAGVSLCRRVEGDGCRYGALLTGLFVALFH